MLNFPRLILTSSALFLGAILYAEPSFASDTTVTCTAPMVQVAAGRDGTRPRVTVFCSGGSSAGAVTYFAYKLDTSATISTPVATANAATAEIIERLVAGSVAENGTAGNIAIETNMNDTSGAAWGCGAGNCRIIDYLEGY